MVEGTLGSQKNQLMATSLIVKVLFLVLPLLGHLAFILQGKIWPQGGSNMLKNLPSDNCCSPDRL